ncbi:MAG: hypothetical protein IPM53_04780 [Anaerolineaceae bacterium]|nr:hypothetical protein [Anaerolineaceae bacterium]
MDPIIYIVVIIGAIAVMLLIAKKPDQRRRDSNSTDFRSSKPVSKNQLVEVDSKSDLRNDRFENKSVVLDRETLIALRTGAAFLYILVAVRVFGIILLSLTVVLEGGNLTELLTFERTVHPIMEFWAGYMLWKGNLNWRGNAILFTILILITIAIRALTALALDIFNLGITLSFLGYLVIIVALAITLFGKASRTRIGLGIFIYVIGFIVSIIGAYIG